MAGLCFWVSCCVFVLGIGPLLFGLLPRASCIFCGCSLPCVLEVVGCILFGLHCGCVVIVMFGVRSHEGAAWGVRIHSCGCFGHLILSAHSMSSLMLFVACAAVDGFSSCSSVQEGSPQPPHSRNRPHIVSGIPRLVRVAVMFVLFTQSASPRFVLQLSCHMLFLMSLSASLKAPFSFQKEPSCLGVWVHCHFGSSPSVLGWPCWLAGCFGDCLCCLGFHVSSCCSLLLLAGVSGAAQGFKCAEPG